jgi:transcriptional regulator with XRE-family HTH domain
MYTNMKTKIEEFEVLIPNLEGTGIAERVKVPVTLEWDAEVKEWLLTPEAHQAIEETKARRIGLLLPAQMKELRERYDYTQKEMGDLFQVGEKSWTRWESGKHRPSRSINLLIRALYDGAVSINYLLKRAGKPVRAESKPTLQALQALSHSCKAPAPDWSNLLAQYFADSETPIQVQLKAGKGKSAIITQLLKLVHDNPGPAEHPFVEGTHAPNRRYSMSAPTHSYPQPRLTDTPTVS